MDSTTKVITIFLYLLITAIKNKVYILLGLGGKCVLMNRGNRLRSILLRVSRAHKQILMFFSTLQCYYRMLWFLFKLKDLFIFVEALCQWIMCSNFCGSLHHLFCIECVAIAKFFYIKLLLLVKKSLKIAHEWSVSFLLFAFSY